MIVFDGLRAVYRSVDDPVSIPAEELGLSPFFVANDWYLYEYHKDSNNILVWDRTGLDNDRLRTLADYPYPVCLDDQEMREGSGAGGTLTDVQMCAERRRGYELMKAHNPKCVVGFIGGNYERLVDVPVDFYVPGHYLKHYPFTGFTEWKAPTDKPVYSIIWPVLPDYGTVPPDMYKLLLDVGVWRKVLEWIKKTYPGCILWDSGAWREVAGGPYIDAVWTNAHYQELFGIAKEVLLEGNVVVTKINEPIALEKPVVQPNGIFCPMIMFATGVGSGGKLQTSCQIQFAAGKMTLKNEDETWERTGQTETIYIPDIDNLETDIAPTLERAFAQGYTDILTVIETINGLRKVL